MNATLRRAPRQQTGQASSLKSEWFCLSCVTAFSVVLRVELLETWLVNINGFEALTLIPKLNP